MRIRKKYLKVNKMYIEITRLFLSLCIFITSIAISNSITHEKREYYLKLNGNETINVTINNEYKDQGFKFYLNDSEIDESKLDVDVYENVKTDSLGQYSYNYSVEYEGKIYNANRIVNVVDDIPPVIKIDVENVEMYSCQKEGKLNLEYIAEDNYDGILTKKVEEIIDEDKVTLRVIDSSGNETIKEIPIINVEEPSPKIVIKGKNIVYVKLGSEYIEEGASAIDACENKIDDEVIIENNVDTKKAGTYEVKYSLNFNDKAVTKTREVVVYNGTINNVVEENREKIIYLTFDDGPGRYTSELLDILKKYNVKATFFVTAQFKNYLPLIKQEYEEGHVVAVHTLTHKWDIYDSLETYIKDFDDMNNIIEEYTGTKATLFRFPGGSSNTVSKGHSKGVVSAIANEMTKRGYVYFDWNVDSCDAAGANSKQIYKNVTTGIEKKNESVVLMHDIKKNTIDTIEDIIIYALENGYTFDTLNVSSPTVHHHINN